MKRLFTPCLTGLILVAWAGVSFAQDVEIEILDQNGNKAKADLVAPIQTDQNPIGGEVTIVSPNGSRQKMNLNQGQSIIVRRSMTSVNENGQQKTQSNGSAVVVNPDGTRQEFALGDEFDLPGFGLPGMRAMGGQRGRNGTGIMNNRRFPGRAVATDAGKYMIGVHSEPMHPAVAAQLNIESGVGLLVKQVSPDSPSAKAGLQAHDVLLLAGDQPLATVKDLVGAVQNSGQDEQALTLSVIRAGKKMTVDVKPVERPAGPAGLSFVPNDMDLRFRMLGPGMMIDEDIDTQFDQQMQRMQQRVQMMEKRFQEMHQRMLGMEGPQPQHDLPLSQPQNAQQDQ